MAFEIRPMDGVNYTVKVENRVSYVLVTGTAATLPIVFKASGSCMNNLHGE